MSAPEDRDPLAAWVDTRGEREAMSVLCHYYLPRLGESEHNSRAVWVHNATAAIPTAVIRAALQHLWETDKSAAIWGAAESDLRIVYALQPLLIGEFEWFGAECSYRMVPEFSVWRREPQRSTTKT